MPEVPNLIRFILARRCLVKEVCRATCAADAFDAADAILVLRRLEEECEKDRDEPAPSRRRL